ncbi:MAG: hypothetical protein ACE5QV_02130, partial [Fidelibacterota bacterium]
MHTFVRLTPGTDLEFLWDSRHNEFCIGTWKMNFSANGSPLKASRTLFKPSSQTTHFSARDLEVEKSFFLPCGNAHHRHFVIRCRFRNSSDKDLNIRIENYLDFLVPLEQSNSYILKGSRVISAGQEGNIISVYGDEVNNRYRRIASSSIPRNLSFKGSTLRFSCVENIPAGERMEIYYFFTYSSQPPGERSENSKVFHSESAPEGSRSWEMEAATHKIPEMARKWEVESQNYMKSFLSKSLIYSPDPRINRAVQWAKINLLKVQHEYKQGRAFTNDPPGDVFVVRDAVWYILGSDYVTPQFSRGLIELILEHGVSDEGKVVEYIRCSTEKPEVDDYDLNINDDAPLLIISVYHHFCVTGDTGWLSGIYPDLKRIAGWIMAQRRGGLVYCSADGVRFHGICGWRNMIDNYSINGYVTEVNSECFYALKVMAEIAGILGEEEDFNLYLRESEDLKNAVKERLVSGSTGLFVLNIDTKGEVHDELTGDLIFPVMFG